MSIAGHEKKRIFSGKNAKSKSFPLIPIDEPSAGFPRLGLEFAAARRHNVQQGI